MARSIQIASVFTAIGFKVNKKDLDKLQKQLGNLKKQIKVLAKASQINFNFNTPELTAVKTQLMGINREVDKLQRKQTRISVRATGGVARGGGPAGGPARGALAGGLVGAQVGQFLPGVGVAGALAFGAADIFKTATGIDAIKTALTAAAGGAAEGEAQFRFLEETTERLGVNMLDNARSFTNFLAASKAVGFGTEEAQEVFTATASAARVLGLSAADTSGAMRAMTQILSKGTVQAEELRGQLGERVPGAVGLMAKAVGAMNGGIEVSVKQLGKMLEQGEIISKDVMPFFAKELQKSAEANGALARAMDSPLANLERMKNAFVRFQVRVGKSEFLDKMTESFKELTIVLDNAMGGAEGIGQVLGTLVDIITDVIKVVAFLFSGLSEIPLVLQAILLFSFFLTKRWSFLIALITLLLPLISSLTDFLNGWEGAIVGVIAAFIILNNILKALVVAGVIKKIGTLTIATWAWAASVNGVTAAVTLLKLAFIALGRTRAFIALGLILGLFAGITGGMALLDGPQQPQLPVTERGPDRVGGSGARGQQGRVTNNNINVDMVNNIETSQAADEVNDQINALINGNMLPEA